MQSLFRYLARISAPLARPLAGRRWFTLWGVLIHRGRKSGRTYRIPIAVGRMPDGFIIPIPFGAGTQWVQNVLANGACRLRWAGREYELTAPEIVDAQVAVLAFSGPARSAVGSARIDRYLRLREATPA